MERFMIGHSLPARRGNAILVGVIVTMVAATAAVTTAEMAMRRHKNSVATTWQAQAVSAVEAVLARRESLVVERAASGDPAGFAQWDSNYGVDIIGGCEVRWKIEPVRTPVADGSNASIPFIANPSPDLSWTPPTGLTDAKGRTLSWEPNDYIYLFRVGAEARVISELGDEAQMASAIGTTAAREKQLLNKPMARAQGARYVTVNNLPLFRWVIFYAAKGPKGDLELSHGSNLNILGNVHSNGSIYLGSAPNTNMWGALKPTLGFTDIGPYDGTYGNWAIGSTYEIGARIAQGTDKYRCIAQHTADAGNQPGSGASWASVWQLQWRTWTAGQTYAISDRVEHGGQRYKCTAPHTAVAGAAAGATEPSVGPAWQSTWERVLEARVSGVNGVFRLSKQTMLGAFNGLPMFGVQPGTFTTSMGTGESYFSTVLTSGNTVVGEPRNAGESAHYLLPVVGAGSLLDFTYSGVVVNPNRVRDSSGLQTQTAGSVDDRIAVNGVPIRGVVDPSDATLPANDSRDVDRAAASKWRTTSRSPAPVGFNQMIRNVETGGKVTILPRSLENRPLEAHRLAYPTSAWTSGTQYKAVLTASTDVNVVNHRGLWWRCIGNHTASAANEPGVTATGLWQQLPGEPHDYARPQFLKPDGSSSDVPVAIGTFANGVEVPGQYQRYALGSASVYLARRAGMTGWDAVTRTGAAASQSATVGLTIRERPVPDTALNPNHTSKIASLSSASALPYAYGKHSRPSLWPFTAADVSSEMFIAQESTGPYSGTNSATIPIDSNLNRAWIHHNTQAATQSYAEGGSMEMRAANNPGSQFPIGWFDSTNGHYRQPYNYADNWRVVQLGKDVVDPAGTGLTATYFNDLYYNTKQPAAGYSWAGPFGGPAVWQGVDLTAGATVPTPPIRPGCGNYGYSVRWTGFLRPIDSDTYNFRTLASYGTRMWLDGKLVVDCWRSSSATDYSTNYGVGGMGTASLTAGQDYPITLEWYQQNTGGSWLLEWKSAADVVWSTVPSTVLKPNLTDATTRQANAADWSTFKAVEMRIDRLTGNALQKAGLMLRGGAGLPALHDGRNPYAAILYSPNRGVFLQARGERSELGKATGPTKFVGRATQGATEITSLAGEMDTEDLNSNGDFDASEDKNSNGLFEDPATVTRQGAFLPLGPDNRAAAAPGNDQGIRQYYMPSTAGDSVWGTSYGSGSGDKRFTNLTVINNPPFAIPEGTVDKVYVGPLTLQTYEVAYRRRYQDIDRYWYFHLDPNSVTDSTQARLITSGTPNDSGKSFRFYQVATPAVGTVNVGDADQGSSTMNPGQHWSANLNNGNNAFLTASTWGVTVNYSGTLTSAFRDFWRSTTYNPVPGTGDFDPNNPASTAGNYMKGGTSTIQTITPATSKTIFYLTSPVDTRPKVYQGSTFVRVLTQSETKSLMEGAYGGTYTVLTSLPGYPNPADPAYPAVADPVAPTYAQGYQDAGWLRAAVTNTATTFPVAHANGFRPGDYVLINAEYVLVTAVFAPIPNTNNHTLTVVRGQLATTAAAHNANNVLVNPTPAVLSAAITNVATSFNVDTAAALQVGDVIRIANSVGTNFELMRITGIAGSTLTVSRGLLTTASAHNAAARVIRVVPRTFRVDRQRTFTFDHNSFTSAWGNLDPTTCGAGNTGWWWTGMAQYRPWSTAMPGSIVATGTGGFQPNQWYPNGAQPLPPTAGGTTTWSVSAALPASARTTSSSGSVVGQVLATPSGTAVSPRWLDDTPASIPLVPPFGGAQVWLRIEKVAATNELRFLWRDGDSGAFTALTRANGTEARLDVGAWFNRPVIAATNAPGTGTGFTVANPAAVGFKVNDLVQIAFSGSNEVARVTALTATSMTLERGRIGTTTINCSAAGAVISSLNHDYRGPDLQVCTAVQGGPRYWTTLAAGVGSSSSGNYQTWSVASTAGMQVGDLLQVGDRRERVQIASVVNATSIMVLRGADFTTNCPGYGTGTPIMSLTNPTSNATTMATSGMKIETTLGNDYGIIDATDWEAASGGAEEMTKYLASQYQVLWGVYDITEDFFSYNQNAANTRLATEEWIYNPREFWSQSRWWEDGAEKDEDAIASGGNGNGSNHDETTIREWLGKTTLLTLNMRQVQDYIRTRTLGEATTPVLGVATAPALSATAAAARLSESFNGLFYLVRTNRYPVNPLPGLANPWNLLLPNTTNEMSNLNLWFSGLFANVLQPYALARAPSFRSNLFHHGVRIINGSDIDWGISGTPAFGVSKTSIVTPNQLFVQGDLNTTPHTVSYQGGTPLKLTPTAIMGDVVTLLSNGWSDSLFRQPGITTSSGSGYIVTAGGSLAMNQGSSGMTLPAAQSTSYYASILTHNQPTTRDSVYLGESSAFINTMQYLEDWSGTNMNFLGSLVVFDSRRYSEAYLLESPKVYGRSPFGYYANGGVNEMAWINKYNALFGITPALTDSQWEGQIGAVQGPPNRNMDFNYDLLTEAGTPPFTPFGVTASGVGAWTKVIE